MNENIKHITFNNGIVYYEQLGEGIPIIFIHPPGLGRKVFDYQKQLATKFNIILPDLSGHGNSQSKLDESLIDQYVKEIKLILEEEKVEEAIICGYSAGGMIAQEFVLTYPSMTKALILSGGYPKVATIGLDMQYKLGMQLLHNSPDILAKILAFSHARNKDDQDKFYHHMRKSNTKHWYLFYMETYLYNCVNRLKYITQPLLTIYGENAFWTNKHRHFYNRVVQNKTIYIDNGFHQLPTIKWKAFNHIIKHYISSNF